MKFTGQYRDQESCLDYFVNRYVSPAMGRFTSPDRPFADQHVGDPQSWNLYSYVRNNPLNGVDPSGMNWLTDALGGIWNGIENIGDWAWTGITQDSGWGPGPLPDPGGIWTEQPPMDLGGGGGGINTGTVYGSGNGGPLINNFQSPVPIPITPNTIGGTIDLATTIKGLLMNFSWRMTHLDATGTLMEKPALPVNPAPRRLFNTYYCGPGGAGPRTGTVNGACAAHDDCYEVAKINANGNTDSSIVWNTNQVAAARGCNQALYDAIKGSNEPGEFFIGKWLLYGEYFGKLRPGTSVQR